MRQKNNLAVVLISFVLHLNDSNPPRSRVLLRPQTIYLPFQLSHFWNINLKPLPVEKASESSSTFLRKNFQIVIVYLLQSRKYRVVSTLLQPEVISCKVRSQMRLSLNLERVSFYVNEEIRALPPGVDWEKQRIVRASCSRSYPGMGE